MKKLTRQELAANRAKLVNSALGRKAFLSDRDLEVINHAESYRVLVYDSRLPKGRFETLLGSVEEVERFHGQLIPEGRERCLIYAIMGQRSALVPKSWYGDLILMPRPSKKG